MAGSRTLPSMRQTPHPTSRCVPLSQGTHAKPVHCHTLQALLCGHLEYRYFQVHAIAFSRLSFFTLVKNRVPLASPTGGSGGT